MLAFSRHVQPRSELLPNMFEFRLEHADNGHLLFSLGEFRSFIRGITFVPGYIYTDSANVRKRAQRKCAHVHASMHTLAHIFTVYSGIHTCICVQ